MPLDRLAEPLPLGSLLAGLVLVGAPMVLRQRFAFLRNPRDFRNPD